MSGSFAARRTGRTSPGSASISSGSWIFLSWKKPDAISVRRSRHTFKATEIASGNLLFAGVTGLEPSPIDPDVELVIDPERSRLFFVEEGSQPETLRYGYGFSAEIGAGTYDRRDSVDPNPDGLHVGGGLLPVLPSDGLQEIGDNKSYRLRAATNVVELKIQANDQRRPYVVAEPDLDGNWIWTAAPRTLETDVRTLELEGLWIGVESEG